MRPRVKSTSRSCLSQEDLRTVVPAIQHPYAFSAGGLFEVVKGLLPAVIRASEVWQILGIRHPQQRRENPSLLLPVIRAQHPVAGHQGIVMPAGFGFPAGIPHDALVFHVPCIGLGQLCGIHGHRVQIPHKASLIPPERFEPGMVVYRFIPQMFAHAFDRLLQLRRLPAEPPCRIGQLDGTRPDNPLHQFKERPRQARRSFQTTLPTMIRQHRFHALPRASSTHRTPPCREHLHLSA